MASPSTHQARHSLQPTNEKERLATGEDTGKSPHAHKSFNDSPYMDEEPNDPTHLDGGVNESPQTDHDCMEDLSESKNPTIEYYKNSYWVKEYAGHVWDDNCGWRVLKPGSPPEPWWIQDPPPRSPWDQDYLCDVCRHIDFAWFFENTMPQLECRARQIVFGTVGRLLKQAKCSFCLLLASSFHGHDLKDMTIYIASSGFSGSSACDCNHPETEVKFLDIFAYLLEVNIQVLNDSRPMRGQQISPYIKQQQQNIARHWLEKCEHEHCNGETVVMVPNLALIDLNQRCIVRPHGPVRYAALSYVWGRSPQKMYSTETQQEFETKGTLHSKQGFLPQTIADAMDLAAHIGLEYLWVDSLCILQDDEADKIRFIGRMGSIYGDSAITIVDANGDDAGCGLVGMSSPRADRQRIATVQGMQLCTAIDSLSSPWLQLHGCAWLKRGWTYQEMLLSKRLLLVTHPQLQFVCNHTVYFEETQPHSPRTSDWTMPTSELVPIRRSAASGIPIWYNYVSAVERFTSRVLTHDTDIIPAFDAIFKALYKNTGAKSLFNLPDIEIEDALLWRSRYSEQDLPSTEDLSKILRRNPGRLPTWSWAGWRGEKRYYQRVGTALISAVLWRCAPTSGVNKRFELALQDYRCADWREKGWNCRFEQGHWSCHVYTHESRPNAFFRNPVELESNVGLHKPPFLDHSNVLHFSAFTVHTSASATIPGLHLEEELFSEPYTIGICDSRRYVAGSMILDCLPADGDSLRLVALSRSSKEATRYCEEQLGVNLRNIAPLDWDPEYFNNISLPNDIHDPIRNGFPWEHFDRRRFQDKFYPFYNVLLVEMREGVAYRIGCGEVHIDAFHAASPIWEHVRLG